MASFQEFKRIETLIRLGRASEARSLIIELMSQIQEDSDLYRLLAVTYLMDEMIDEAISNLETAIELSAQDPLNYLLLGISYKESNDLDNAIFFLEKALEIDPELAECYDELAQIYLGKEIFGKANFYIEKLATLKPDSQELFALKAYYENILNKSEDSQKYLLKGLAIDPNHLGLLLQKGRQELREGDYIGAKEKFELIVSAYPENFQMREALIDSFLGRYLFYKWAVLKFRLFTTLGYMVVGGVFSLVMFSGLFLRDQHMDSEFFPLVYYLALFISCWSLLFWLTRVVGHTFVKWIKWKLPLSFCFDLGTLVSLGMITVLSFFLTHILTKDFFWFASALMLCVLIVMSSAYTIIENDRNKKLFKYYIIYLFSLGAGTFICGFANFDLQIFNGTLLVFSIFIPFISFALYELVKDCFKNNKAKELSKNSKKEKGEILGWIHILMIINGISLIIIGSLYGSNIIDFIPFILFWLGISFACICIWYRYHKNKNSGFFSYVSMTESMSDISSKIAVSGISIIVFVFIIGVLCTSFVGWDSYHSRVPIIMHGYDQLNKKEISIKVVINDKKVKLRPSRNQTKELYGKDSVDLNIHHSLFGIRYAVVLD